MEGLKTVLRNEELDICSFINICLFVIHLVIYLRQSHLFICLFVYYLGQGLISSGWPLAYYVAKDDVKLSEVLISTPLTQNSRYGSGLAWFRRCWG